MVIDGITANLTSSITWVSGQAYVAEEDLELLAAALAKDGWPGR